MTEVGGLTRQLDLRTGRAVWGAYRAPRVPAAPLRADARTDVLVVGMGISGAMVAEALTAAGHAVMLIDRRGPVLGSTAATTALVQFEIDTPLLPAGRAIGRDRAERAWRRSRLAVDNLGPGSTRSGLALPTSRAGGRSISPATARRGGRLRGRGGGAAGGGALCATTSTPRGCVRTTASTATGAIVSHDNLALDPRKLTAGLLRAARGARGAAACAGRGDALRAFGGRASRSGPPAGR